MTVKVELSTPRQPYLESGLLPADFYAYEELLSEPEREKILNGSGHRPIRALQGNLTGIAYVEVHRGRGMSAMLTTEDGPGRRHRVVIGSGCGGLTVDGARGRRRATAGASLSVEVGAGRRHSQFLPELRHRGSRGFRRCRQPCLQTGGPQRPAEEVRSSPRLTKP